MSITASTTLRELDQREGDGLTVTLLWNAEQRQTYIRIDDARSGDQLEYPVQAEKAADAFDHPFVFIPSATLR